ncbi:MAG: hypothetical protein SFU83_23595 [Meiothermus sp.]|nr:hypothetical protein [Meiothermus sp.]
MSTSETVNEAILAGQAELLEHPLVKPRCLRVAFYLSTDLEDRPQWVAKFVSRGIAVDWIGLGASPKKAWSLSAPTCSRRG